MNGEDLTIEGHWGVAIMMVVIVSWILYKYVMPKSFKEWRNVGLIQAFIIALYAEMYGFPLTIYILSSLIGIDIPWLHIKGHLWSTLLGLGEAGAMVEMFIGYSIIFTGLFLLGRGWHLIYSAQDEDKLVTEGLYRYMRHPQYTGIFIALFGQLIHWPTIPTLILFPGIVWAYYHLSRKEEKKMNSQFGEDYRSYTELVPMFFPKLKNLAVFVEGK